ncbi:MAG: AMP-binding protein [Spirochaetes bacterium]|nr:AMP-binding protein [Spirochaetota bacterium]
MFPKPSDKIAIYIENQEISYNELVQNIISFASYLKIKKGDRVVIFAENSPEWIYAFYSIWAKKGIAVPCDYNLKEDDLAYILNNCKPVAVFCSVSTLPVVKKAIKRINFKPRIHILEQCRIKSYKRLQFPEINYDDTAIIMYTSGTTGKPKGVMLTYDNLLCSIQAIANLKMLTEHDRMIALLPFYHIFPLQGCVTAPLYLNASIVMVKELIVDKILAALQKHKVTMFLGIPRLYELLHKNIMAAVKKNPVAYALFLIAKLVNNLTFSKILFKNVHNAFGGHIHAFLTGGAKLDPVVANDLKTLGFNLVEGYGLTETAPLVAFNPFSKVKLGSVGLPVKGTEVKIVDGEILVKGRNVMKGYYKNKKATDEIITDGWFHTRDTGYFDKDGYLYVTGRKDDMIVLPSGKNINPEEIEKHILRISPLIKEIGVIEDQGNLTAVIHPDYSVITKENIVNILETIKRKVINRYNASVASYKHITKITISKDELPKTRLGKLQRYIVKQLVQNEKKSKTHEEIKEPKTIEYKSISRFLAIHTRKKVLPHHNLLVDLGLDSLGILSFQTYIEETFGIKISNADILNNPTVEELSTFIAHNKSKFEEHAQNWLQIIIKNTSYTFKHGFSLILFLKLLIKPLAKLYFQLKLNGKDNIPESPVIFAPNHQSFLDSLLLIASLPNKTLMHSYFLSRELGFIKVSRGDSLAKLMNTIIVNIDTNLKDSIQKMASILQNKRNIIIFPEGTRTIDGQLGTFKKTFAILSKELNCPVVPIAIRGAYQSFKRGKLLPKPTPITIDILPPIYPDKLTVDNIVAKTQAAIAQTLKLENN